MALTGTYTFSVNRDDAIREAMLNVGAIGESEVPTAQEVTDCARKLNMIFKQWMGTFDFAPGLKMWTRQRGDLFLSSTKNTYGLGSSGDNWAGGVSSNTALGVNYAQGQLSAAAAANATTLAFGVGNVAQFTAGDFLVVQLNSGDIYSTTVSSVNSGAGTIAIPATGLPSAAASTSYVWNYTTKAQRPLEIVTCILRDIQNNDTPLQMLTLQEYEALPSKNQTGNLSDPTMYYYESQFVTGTAVTGPGVLYIDCYGAQDVTKHLHVVYLRTIQDLTNPSDNFEFPQQWYRPICWALSREIAPMFDAEWSQESQANLTESMAIARQADPETTAMYFQSDGGL